MKLERRSVKKMSKAREVSSSSHRLCSSPTMNQMGVCYLQSRHGGRRKEPKLREVYDA